MNDVSPFVLIAFVLMGVALNYKFIKNEKFILNTIKFKYVFIWKLKKLLYMLGITFLIIAIIDWSSIGKGEVSVNTEKGDVFFALDFTSSMRVRDTDDGDRISFAINKILDSLFELDAHRFGLVIFSDKQYQLIPLTTDREFFRQHLLSLQENVKPDGGGYIESAFKEVESRASINTEMSVVVLSDFENIGLSKGLLNKYSKLFNLIAFKIGSVAGSRIPKLNQMKYGKIRYLTKGGREIFSYFNKEDFELFENRAERADELIDTFKRVSSNSRKKQQRGWVSSTERSYGSIFVAIGLFFLFLCRGLLWFSRYFAISLVITVLPQIVFSQMDSTIIDQTHNKIINGNGSHLDFIDYANSFIGEKKHTLALKLYSEQDHKLNKLNKLNLGTLKFLNKDINGGLQIYLRYLESNLKSSSKENEIVRNNLIILFNQKAGASGKSKSESKRNKGEDGKGQGRGSPNSGRNKQQSSMKGMSNEDILSKIKSDDMVNQGEYIKKKIKNKNKNEVRW